MAKTLTIEFTLEDLHGGPPAAYALAEVLTADLLELNPDLSTGEMIGLELVFRQMRNILGARIEAKQVLALREEIKRLEAEHRAEREARRAAKAAGITLHPRTKELTPEENRLAEELMV